MSGREHGGTPAGERRATLRTVGASLTATAGRATCARDGGAAGEGAR
ncbi:DUF6380 family protein [Streptomyces minutiscleroticus]